MNSIDCFPDLEAHLGARHAVRRVRTFCVEIDGIGRRAVTVRAERLFGREGWWFGLAALICPEVDVHASRALRHNYRLAVGALAGMDASLWLRAVLRLLVMADDIDSTIVSLADDAARILEIPRGPDASALFSNLAD
jgi:hypothetical protein